MTFLVAELIRKKRDGAKLSPDEISFLVRGFSSGTIPDYQITAWLMAAFIRGLDLEETFQLTRQMKESGKSLDWRKISSNFSSDVFVDKHSTGGIGDKVSLILAPIAAALGLKVPMMSGRGLGHTGGTVDKLESIEGFTMYPSEALMVKCLDEVGLCMMAQAPELCPADRKLYSLRDVTATVENISLITASILSKKWAEGVDAIVFDVKSGSAAFMESEDDSRALASSLARTAKRAGLKASSIRTRMEEPLGAFVGNALEVQESYDILAGTFADPKKAALAQGLRDLSLGLSAEMLFLSGRTPSFESALEKAKGVLEKGEALKIFEKMILAQGGKPHWQSTLSKAPHRIPLLSPRAGHIQSIRSRGLGVAGLHIGMGRTRAEDKIDSAVGFEMNVSVGDTVKKGDVLLWAHLRHPDQFEIISKGLLESFNLSDQPTHSPPPLIIERILP